MTILYVIQINMQRFIAIGAFCLLTCAYAQTPSFDVATVKPNNSGSGNSGIRTSKGEFSMTNVTLKDWIKMAYDVKDYSLSAPPWLADERFDVVAKPPSGVQLDWYKPQVYKPMLQRLLVDRFKLAFHRETKTLPAYALVADKGGTKVEPAEASGPQGTTVGRGLLAGTRLSMADFAGQLSGKVDRPVQDLTGLQGVYNFKVTWTEEDRPAAEPAEITPGPSLFTAIQEQLGLKLEGRKLPIEILVIDHIERVPTEN